MDNVSMHMLQLNNRITLASIPEWIEKKFVWRKSELCLWDHVLFNIFDFDIVFVIPFYLL